MSSVSTAALERTESLPKQMHPLLEELYTFYGLDQLKDMLSDHTDEAVLKKWNVTEAQYKANVEAAIKLVIND